MLSVSIFLQMVTGVVIRLVPIYKLGFFGKAGVGTFQDTVVAST